MKKILFLNLPDPPGKNLCRDFMGGFGAAYRSSRRTFEHDREILSIPPIFPAYAAALLEHDDFDPAILDAQALNLDVQPLLNVVRKLNPDIIVSRLSLSSLKDDISLMKKIKEVLPDVFLIAWGTICKIFPQEILEEGTFDLAIRDEMEFTVLELIRALNGKKSLSQVEGVSFKSEGRIIHNATRPFVKNLDVLPFPAFHLLDMEKYVTFGSSTSLFFPNLPETSSVPYFCIYSSRGCPFNCVYCAHPIAFGPWRAMSPQKTVDEIEFLVNNYGVKAIRFLDQEFSLDIDRAIKICDEIINRGLNIHWVCETRADRITRDLVRKMKKAGCVRVEMGVETGDPELLRSFGKSGLTFDAIEKAFRITREEELPNCAYIMVGLPGETWTTVEKTRSLIKRIKPYYLSIQIATPLPGTPFYDMAQKMGWLISDDWSDFTMFDPVISYPNFSMEDMRKARIYLYTNAMFQEDFRRIWKAIKEARFGYVAKKIVLGLPNIAHTFYDYIKYRLKGRFTHV
jgi:radical SAM superfamily enzyme YgiQ (UPF0313 family)